MLTYPCDSLPQIVCPMDGDAIPSNPFCSAPPQSEPPPPLLPLSSITPSLANDGIPGHRRSGRIQGVTSQTLKKQSNTDSDTAWQPSRQKPSPTKRQKDGSMVQVLQTKQLGVESTHLHGKPNEDGFDFSYAAECQIKQNDQKSLHKKTNVSATQDVVEQFADDTAHNDTDATMSDMVTCRGLDTLLDNTSVPKGWEIGPLFQSFKSKMASFTEIVMSPVKLFRANSPPLSMDHPEKVSECERPADGPSDVEHSEPSNMLHPEGVRMSENRDSEAEATQQRLTDDMKYCKKVLFDKELPAHSSEANENSCYSGPMQHSSLPCFVSEYVSETVESAVGSSVLLQSSVIFSTSHESKLEIHGDVHDQKDKRDAQLKQLPRKRTGNRSEAKKTTSKSVISEFRKEDIEASDSSDNNKSVPISSLDCYTQPDADRLQLDGDENETEIESCCLIRQSLQNNLNGANGRTPKPNTGIQKPDDSAACLGRAKRGLKQQYDSQGMAKRKKQTGDKRTGNSQKQQLLSVTSDGGILRRLPREEVVLTGTFVDTEQIPKANREKAVSTKSNKKGKGGQEVFPTVNEAMLKTETESSSEAMLVCSLDKSSDVVNNQKVYGSSKMKPVVLCKRLKTRAGLTKPDVRTDDGMDLETPMAISSTKQVEEGLLSDVFVCPDIKPLQRKSSIRKKIMLKRKSPIQEGFLTESDSVSVSTSSVQSRNPSELMATDFNMSLPFQREENLKTGLDQPSKRPKKGLKGAFKSSQEAKKRVLNINVITKERQYQEGKGKISMDPVYFELTPSENNHQPAPPFSQPHSSCCVLLNNEVKPVVDEKEKCPDSVVDEVFPADYSVSRLRSSARRVTVKPGRADKQRRRCRVLQCRTCKGEEVTNSVTMEDADLAATPTRPSENGFSRCLLRSYSCPEIPSFRSRDVPWPASLHIPHRSRTPTSHQSSYISHAPHAHKSIQRARRHTVCSVEVEREIAPLCLRKEVYPSRRSAPHDGVAQYLSPTVALSPSTTLSALASCFLSSPLAFLSKKFDSRSANSSPSKSSHVSSPSCSSLTSPLTASTWCLPAFLQSDGSSHATLESSSRNPLACDPERGRCKEEYGEDTSSSSQEYEDVGLREEKALSDSEIKVEHKHEERGKVSSIRIRKTLPKPQNNLTPMGLPKPVRLKKKQFSLEEIYTNKNFSKPPESRLETIFEVPLNRRNGSESWFGQRRVKRLLEFQEVGEVRKPKKPLVGVGKTGVSSSRTRRGAFTKDEPSMSAQDVDSLLCAKLDELNLWLIHDQNS